MRLRIACTLLALATAAPVWAQLDNVGNISFPTSASATAQPHFLRGVAILHSFGWKQAIEEFQLAQKAQPDFALAYWGETLCYNHPLNPINDDKNPRAVLARLGPNRAARIAKAPTAREKGFMEAVEDLWAEGPDWRARRVAYMNAMERLHKQFPNDDEVKAFYALSILSGSRATDDTTFRSEQRAGALAYDILMRNPKHPGAVHYIIHAFDDPVHAPMALNAAKVYADIVPAVSHAVHMPTHIFIQHGMWNEVTNQNTRAFNIARDLLKPGDTPGDLSHSGDWGHYGFLQLGEYAQAAERTRQLEAIAVENKHPRLKSVIALTKARYIIETEEWKVQPVEDDALDDTIFANGVSAARTNDIATAERMLTLIEKQAVANGGAPMSSNPHADHGAPAAAPAAGRPAQAAQVNTETIKYFQAIHKELAALIAEAKGNRDQAIALLKEGVQIEESMRPPNGAASPIKPSHELLGEVLMRAGKPAEAAAMFDASLYRTPNRMRSLSGAAQAYAAAGNHELAAQRWATLNSFWKGKPFANATAR